jgi:2'-hydroxyisoflavone reductase
MSMEEMLAGIKATVSNPVEFVWVDESWLLEQQVQPWMGLPLWIPQDASTAGAGRAKVAKAFAHGLRCRPLAETARDTLGDFEATRGDRSADFAWGSGRTPGISEARELELLRAWASRTP